MELWRTGLVLVLSSTLCSALWAPGTETVYQYYARLDANTLFPTEAMSRWSMNAKLVVQANEDKIIVQLQDVRVATYNGLLHHNTTIKETPPPDEVSHLFQPFILHLENGKVVDLSVKAGEDVWAINMKRGLAGLLQLDPSLFHETASFSTENGPFGEYSVEYAVHNSTDGKMSVTKSLDFSKSSGFPKQTIMNSEKWLNCPSDNPQNPLDVVSIRYYDLEPRGPNGELIISTAVADGGIYYHPFHAESESLYIWTWMELHLESSGKIEKSISVKGGGEAMGLKYEMPGMDVSQGRNPPSQEELISAVTKMLQELGESLEPPGLETNLTKLHEERVAHVLYFLSLLNHTSFSQLYSDLAVGTSYQHETFRNLFMEILPLVGSHDALLLIRDLVMGGTLKNDTAVQLLSAAPFSIRNPSEQLLKDFEVILTIPEKSVLYSTAILTFPTLVHKVHKAGIGSEIIDKYVAQYFDLFSNSGSHEKQMLYLGALENFDMNRVVQYLTPVIQGTDPKYSHHIRYLAAWATGKHYISANSKEAYQLYWPIFSDRSEPLEMRVVALTMLLVSSPNAARMYRLQSFMLGEQDRHLQHYWYTTLQAYSHTTRPCNPMADVARKILLYFPEPKVRHWATGNYILDYKDTKYGFGSQTYLYTVANPQTGLPSNIYMQFSNYAMDYDYNQYSFYVRLDGIGDLLKRTITRNITSVDKVVQLLKELKLPFKPTEPIHIELILKVQNKAVLVHHANETTFKSLFAVLNNIKLLTFGGVHVNTQNIVVPFLLQEMRMTDVGTTALLRETNSWMMSMRANLTMGKHVLTQMELRSYLSSQTALTQYNPMLDMWHGVQRSLNLQAIVPLDFQFSTPSAKNRIKFVVQQTPGEEAGIVGHLRTAVFVRGITATGKLKAHCSTCPSQEIVTRNNDHSPQEELAEIELLGIKLQLALLDCENAFRKELLEQLEHTNLQVSGLPVGSSLIPLLHLYDYITLVPPSGSCGVTAKLSSLAEEPTQVEIEILVNNTESNSSSLASGNYNLKINVTTNSSSHWEINTQFAHSRSPSKHSIFTNVSSNDGHVASWNLSAAFPEPSADVTFLSGVDPHSAAVEINAEWGSSSLQVSLQGEVTSQQQDKMTDSTLWPYSVCKKDLRDVQQWGHLYAPLTQACFEVARELATLRSYKFSINSSNLPDWLDDYALNDVNVELEVPQESAASVTYNGRKEKLSSFDSKKLQSWLINTQFPPILQMATYMGVVGSCVATSQSVWTVDGAHLNVSIGDCYSLAFADCSDSPQFALLVKKVHGTKHPLALKVYTGDNYVEILPTAKKLSVIVDDNEVKNPLHGYQHPVLGNYKFKVWQRSDGLVQIHLRDPHMWVEYYGHFATMTVLGVYRGKLCGICGDHNGDGNNDAHQLYSLSCPA